MGRLLDLIFPERVYRRMQREEMARQIKDTNEQVSALREMIVRIEASRIKRDKSVEELMLKLYNRIDELERKNEALEKMLGSPKTDELLLKTLSCLGEFGGSIERIEKKLDAKGPAQKMSANGDKVTQKQVVSEYLYGVNGDE